jgi:hypothetical protein
VVIVNTHTRSKRVERDGDTPYYHPVPFETVPFSESTNPIVRESDRDGHCERPTWYSLASSSSVPKPEWHSNMSWNSAPTIAIA